MSRASDRKRRDDVEQDGLIDRELAGLAPQARWREWMARVEAVLFASSQPVPRDVLARVVGSQCGIDLIIADIREELRDRPYDIVSVAGGWQHRTRPAQAAAIRTALGITERSVDLTHFETMVLMTIAYFQPLTRGQLSTFFGREISRDLIGSLRSAGYIASGPRSPELGAPYTYVTTRAFLSEYGFETLRDLPDFEKLEEAGLLSHERLVADLDGALRIVGDGVEAAQGEAD